MRQDLGRTRNERALTPSRCQQECRLDVNSSCSLTLGGRRPHSRSDSRTIDPCCIGVNRLPLVQKVGGVVHLLLVLLVQGRLQAVAAAHKTGLFLLVRGLDRCDQFPRCILHSGIIHKLNCLGQDRQAFILREQSRPPLTKVGLHLLKWDRVGLKSQGSILRSRSAATVRLLI